MKKQTSLKSRQHGNVEPGSLAKSFDDRYSKSDDKETLLKREIEVHELLFDEKKLPLSTNVFSSNRPIKYLNCYTDHDIVLIREAYQKYIVNGADINEAGEWFRVNKGEHKEDDSIIIIDGKGRAFKKFPPTGIHIHYYNEAKKRFGYMNWLKKFIIEPPVSEKKLSLTEVALICAYEERIITRENGNDIAKEYGFSSGESLYQDYLKCYKTVDRIGKDLTPLRTRNKIARIEKIIPYLSKSLQVKANKEVSTLKANLEKEGF